MSSRLGDRVGGRGTARLRPAVSVETAQSRLRTNGAGRPQSRCRRATASPWPMLPGDGHPPGSAAALRASPGQRCRAMAFPRPNAAGEGLRASALGWGEASHRPMLPGNGHPPANAAARRPSPGPKPSHEGLLPTQCCAFMQATLPRDGSSPSQCCRVKAFPRPNAAG